MNIVGKVLELSEENISKVVAKPEDYINFCFILGCSKRRHMSKFNRLVCEMLSVWRHYNWTFIFTNPYDDLDSFIKQHLAYTYK